MPIMGKTPIADLGDTGDADLRMPPGLPGSMGGSSMGMGAVTPGFGSSPTSIGTQVNNNQFQAPVSHAPDRTASAAAAVAGGAESTVAHSKESTDWINNKWRPAMGWLYMGTCFFDFVIFPILWSILQTVQGGQVTNQWQPLTLQGAGLYHIAMGAVLGIAAYGRTKEKLEQKQ